MKFFVLEYHYADLERRAEVRPRHLDYVRLLNAQGKVVMAGPLADGTGAIVVYRGENETEVRRMIDEDPYTMGRITAEVTLREWDVLIPADPLV